MPENLQALCLELCRQARGQEGEALQQKLALLEKTLESIVDSNTVPSPMTETVHWHNRIFGQLRQPVITMDLAGYLISWNQAAEILFGYSAEEVIGRHVLFLNADEADSNREDFSGLFLEDGSSFLEVRRRKKSGEIFWAGLSLSLLRDDDGEPFAMVAQLYEQKERLSADERLRLHANIFEHSDQGILVVDAKGHIVSVNTAFSRITGYTAEEMIGRFPEMLRCPENEVDFPVHLRSSLNSGGTWRGEIVGRRKNGELFPQSVSISVVRNDRGEITYGFSILTDLTLVRDSEQRMLQLAYYDGLTGLPNRTMFHQQVTQALAEARRSLSHGALLTIDLNRFTSINDTLGHEVGDELLRQAGQRFRQALRTEDILARVAGDEFVVALTSIAKREHVGVVARKILDSLIPPFLVDTHVLHVAACIGIAVYPDDGMEITTLLRCSDLAMKREKECGGSTYRFYDSEMDQNAREHLRMEAELRHALMEAQLFLCYQPKVSLRSGAIVGAEALVRWQHPERGLVPPDQFISLAEETGLIDDLGHWVLNEACRQIREWQNVGVSVPPIAVNLSVRQFDPELPLRIQQIMEQHAVDPEFLRLEITESVLAGEPEAIIPIMNNLVARGLALSLDDFGTGFSSLSYLKKYPITTLKIDRSFVIGIPHDVNDCAIARAIVTMGQQLRQEIVAEGVENPEQMVFLRELGCDQLQGYLFSRPLAACDFKEMLCQNKRLAFN